MMKKYNIKRHYVTKHANTYEKFKGKVRKDKFQNLKKSIKAQQSVFIRASRDTSKVKLSFKVSEAIAKSCRPFSDDEFIKDYIGMLWTNCAQKKGIRLKIQVFLAPQSQEGSKIFLEILKMHLK